MVIPMNISDDIASFNVFTDFSGQYNSYCQIDLTILGLAAATQYEGADTNLITFNMSNISGLLYKNRFNKRSKVLPFGCS